MSSTQRLANDEDEIHGDQKSAAFVVLSTTGPKVAVTFGSKFEGSDGVIFSGSDGTGFDATNSGAIALGFFYSHFDLNKAVLRGDMTQILGTSIHSTVQVLMQRQLLVISQRVEQLPRMV